MRSALGALLGLSLSTACYAPKVLGGAPCDPENPDSCPSGQTCETRSNGSFCSGGTAVDGGTSDAPPGSFCLGAHLLGSVCLASAPDVATKLIGSTTVNTSSTNPGNCTQILSQPGGPSLCVITGDTVEITAGVTLRAVGPNPLVLFAAHTVTVAGTIDVSSRVGETAILGAGARQAADCNTLGINGAPSDNGNQLANAGGGGAGGTYGGTGGTGGAGKGNIKGGVAVASSLLNVLIGGCPGGKGGDGSDGGGFGLGGNGGGAVYLIAGDTVTVTGVVNASGAGGGPGVNGSSSSGGGGGGGAGGMIGAEAPHIMLAGSVFANGGGGGAGGGNQPSDHGLPGNDPAAALTPAPGGKGTNGGADGGTGSGIALVGGAGKSVTGNNTNQCAGGGGGGGGGIIRLFGDPAPTLGMISPPKT